MEIILKKDVEGLGLEFDTVKVKSGYARNFLLPKGFASLATKKNREELAKILELRREEEEKLISAAREKIKQLESVSLSITAKVGSSDKLVGSISNSDVVDALGRLGVSIDKKYIKIPGNTIKRLGSHVAKIRLHRDVEYEYTFHVVPMEGKERPKAQAQAQPKGGGEEE